MGKKKFYVVWHGVSPGIYTSWTDCKLQINGFEGAIYKSFDTQEEAERAYNTSPYLYIQKKKTTAPAVSGNAPTDVPSYRHDTVLPLPPEVPAVEDDLTLVNDDHGLTLNADFVMLQRVFYQPLGGQLGVTNGMADGTFGVNNTCTRGQSVTFLYRALGTAPSTVNGFTDVAADSFCAGAVAWAVENGVTNGTSATTFSPADGCTRAQIVTFLYRAYQGK